MTPRPPTPRGVEAVWHQREAAWAFRVRWTDPTGTPSPKTGRKPRLHNWFWTIDEAVAFHADVERMRRAGTLGKLSRGVRELGAFVRESWWPNYATVELAAATLRSYASVWNRHIDQRVGHLPMQLFLTPEVQQFREAMETDGVGAPTIRRALAILQGIFSYAVVVGEILVNPAREVTKPAITRQRAIDPPSPAQIERVLAELEPADAMLVELLAYEGIRPQEALALQVLHRRGQTLLIEQKNVDGEILIGLKTGRRRARAHRSPELHRPVGERLDQHIRRLARNSRRALLFPSPKTGGPWTASEFGAWRRDVFMPAVERAGVAEIITRPYDLRHACASLMIHAGRPLTDISENLGNSVATLSAYYSHIIKDLRDVPTTPIAAQITQARLASESKETSDA